MYTTSLRATFVYHCSSRNTRVAYRTIRCLPPYLPRPSTCTSVPTVPIIYPQVEFQSSAGTRSASSTPLLVPPLLSPTPKSKAPFEREQPFIAVVNIPGAYALDHRKARVLRSVITTAA